MTFSVQSFLLAAVLALPITLGAQTPTTVPLATPSPLVQKPTSVLKFRMAEAVPNFDSPNTFSLKDGLNGRFYQQTSLRFFGRSPIGLRQDITVFEPNNRLKTWRDIKVSNFFGAGRRFSETRAIFGTIQVSRQGIPDRTNSRSMPRRFGVAGKVTFTF